MLANHSKIKIAVVSIVIWVFGYGKLEAQNRIASHAANQRDLDGVLQPYVDIDVASTETGIIRKVFVKPGHQVTVGQPLAEFDSEAIQAQLRVKKTEAESTGKLDQAKAELDLQQAKFDKLSKLLESGKSSAMEVERAKADLIIAQGRFRNEEDSIRVLKTDLERFYKQQIGRAHV